MKLSRVALAFCLWVLLLPYVSFAAAPAPTASILNPKPGTKTLPTLISLRQTTNDFRVQLQVWDDLAITANSVKLWYCNDTGTSNPETPATCGGGAYGSVTLTSVNANYSCGTNCAVYEGNVSTLTAGNSYYIYASADSSDGTGESRQNRTGNDARYVYVKILAPKTGTGSLLARDSSSQICMDCHNVSSHSSQSTDTSYGNWQTVCLECHTPHNTNNIYLVRQSIVAPDGVTRNVTFFNATGDANNSYVNSGAAASTQGLCQVCHTKTQGAGNVVRWRFNGNADSHYTAAAGTQSCRYCHSHTSGFKGLGCDGCHDYDTTGGGSSWGRNAQSVEGWGAHAKHINHIKALAGVTLTPASDSFGTGTAAAVCGSCHTNTGPHDVGGGGSRLINFGDGTYTTGGSGAGSFNFVFGGTPIYSGVSGSSSSVNPKSCSNISCHFITTPVWSSY